MISKTYTTISPQKTFKTLHGQCGKRNLKRKSAYIWSEYISHNASVSELSASEPAECWCAALSSHTECQRRNKRSFKNNSKKACLRGAVITRCKQTA